MTIHDLSNLPPFKVKTEEHRVVDQKVAVQVDPQVAASASAFAAMFVTEPRCDQGVEAVGGTAMKNIAAFIQWMSQDVEKESSAELAASGLAWRDVQGSVSQAARKWFLAKQPPK